MKNQSYPSEEELAKEAIKLHDRGLGFRRIGRSLGISKDRAWRLYHKYKPLLQSQGVQEDKELTNLAQRKKRAETKLAHEKQKDKLRREITDLKIERATATYHGRRKIFSNPEELTRFAEKALKITAPHIWDDYLEFCEEYGYEPLDLVQQLIGDQKLFEQLARNSSFPPSLALYVAEKMEKGLAEIRAHHEEIRNREELEANIDEEEIFSYEDENGDLILSIPRSLLTDPHAHAS